MTNTINSIQFIFLDLECVRHKQTNENFIYQIGYFIVDKNFKVLDKNNYYISPNIKLDNWGPSWARIRSKQNQLGRFDKINILKQEKFNEKYEFIKNLLESKNTLVLGHGIQSDIKFLNDECNRYKLPKIKFIAIDTIKIWLNYCKRNSINIEDSKLETIGKWMKIDFTAHHAIDDVKVNLAYMKHISKENDKNLFDIIEPYERIDSIFKVNNTFINKTIWYIKLLHNAFIGKKYTFDDSMNENKKACRRCISLFALFGMEYTFLNNADFCVCYSTCGQQTLTKTIIYLNFDRIFIDLRNEIRSLPKISDSLNDESIMKVIKKFKEEFELLVKN